MIFKETMINISASLMLSKVVRFFKGYCRFVAKNGNPKALKKGADNVNINKIYVPIIDRYI